MTPDERRARALRAAEVLSSMGWAFEELIQEQQNKWLRATTPEAREEHHRIARATGELAGHLASIVNAQQAQEKLDERRGER